MEAGVVLDLQGQPIYWHLPPGRSGGSLPDSRDLWDVLWENRDNLSGFAHSHPGFGVPGPSHTDVTTFAAVEAGLGARLDWWIITSDSIGLFKWRGPERLAYPTDPFCLWGPLSPMLTGEPAWINELRRVSYDLGPKM